MLKIKYKERKKPYSREFIVGVENEDAGLPYSYVVFNCDKYKNK